MGQSQKKVAQNEHKNRHFLLKMSISRGERYSTVQKNTLKNRIFLGRLNFIFTLGMQFWEKSSFIRKVITQNEHKNRHFLLKMSKYRKLH